MEKTNTDFEIKMKNNINSMIEEDDSIVKSKIKELKNKYHGKFLLVRKQESWTEEPDEFSYIVGEKGYIEKIYDMAQGFNRLCWVEEIK